MMMPRKKNNFLLAFLFNEKILTVFLLIIIVLLSVPLYNNYHRRQKINNEISALETEIKLAESKDTDLQKLIKYLESDQFVEEQARLNLNMKKPGESVTVVNDSAEAENNKDSRQIVSSVIRDNGTASSAGYVFGWWRYFFK